MSAIRDVRSGRGALGGAVRLVLVVSPADDLAAQGVYRSKISRGYLTWEFMERFTRCRPMNCSRLKHLPQ
jgi:hypothetical protein